MLYLSLIHILYTIDDENDKMVFHEQQIKDSLDKIKALAIGMGWGKSDQYEKILSYILQEYSIPIVIDADGLNTLARMNKDIIKHTNCKVILTPHVKEFERLSKINIEDIKDNTIAIAKEFAKREQVILLLKGPTTIVTDGEIVYLVKRGCPGMETAGSGDILSGIIVGLLGFQKPDTFTVATAAYINGLSGEIAQERYTDISMIASDTVRCIPVSYTHLSGKEIYIFFSQYGKWGIIGIILASSLLGSFVIGSLLFIYRKPIQDYYHCLLYTSNREFLYSCKILST